MYTKKLRRYKQSKEDFKEMKIQTMEELRPGSLAYKNLPSLISDYFDTSKMHDPFMDQIRHKKGD